MNELERTLRIPGVGLRTDQRKEPKSRRAYHRAYQKRRLADPERRAAYNEYQRKYQARRKAVVA